MLCSVFIGGVKLAYFLKQTKLKKGTYLQIYDSFRDKNTKKSKHKSYKAIGYVEDIIASGIKDPIEYYKKEVKKLNNKRTKELIAKKAKKISDDPIKNIGYFLPKAVLKKLDVAHDIRYMNLMRDFNFDIYDLIEDLVCSRMVSPCSKLKTWSEIIPSLYKSRSYSLNQIYEGVEFIGSEYEKIIEIFNHHISKIYGRKTSKVYFDCTNYYFEIDAEFQDKMKGPSKENRTDPIIGMALMLDENQLPICMKMYPGNEIEKPKLHNMLNDLRKRHNITGKTIQVADKGLNCSNNIVSALLNEDGYIFSKSLKQLSAVELEWVLKDDEKYTEVYDKDNKLKFKYRACTDDFEYVVNTANKTKKRVSLREKRVIIWNPKLAEKQTHEIKKLMDKATALTAAKAKKSEFGEASKYVKFTTIDKTSGEIKEDDVIIASINEEKYEKDISLAGYNLLVTSETNMSAMEIYNVYHNLWRIEESFRILKSQLDARPVYLQKRESIYGHFLICYISILLLRILQFNTFKSTIGHNEIMNFIQNFKCLIGENNVINTSSQKIVKNIDDKLNLNLLNYYFSENDIKKLLNLSI